MTNAEIFLHGYLPPIGGHPLFISSIQIFAEFEMATVVGVQRRLAVSAHDYIESDISDLCHQYMQHPMATTEHVNIPRILVLTGNLLFVI